MNERGRVLPREVDARGGRDAESKTRKIRQVWPAGNKQ